MIVKILIGLAALLIIFVIVVALRPGDFKVERSVVIAAPAAAVFEQVNDLHQFQTWSPWAKMDPDAVMAYEGPSAGVGAAFRWKAKKTGEGKMTNIESKPGERIHYRLDFQKPFQATNLAEFDLVPDGNQTRVTWKMSGKNHFFFKAIGLFMNHDRMIGGEFEKGLADLKKIAESNANH